jgi:hypothetical protein
MATATTPTPEVALWTGGLRAAAKALAGVDVDLTGVHAAGRLWAMVTDVDQARALHDALGAASDRVVCSGPHGGRGHVSITHDFALNPTDQARLEVSISVPPAVADEITPSWREAAPAPTHEAWCPLPGGHDGTCEDAGRPFGTPEAPAPGMGPTGFIVRTLHPEGAVQVWTATVGDAIAVRDQQVAKFPDLVTEVLEAWEVAR